MAANKYEGIYRLDSNGDKASDAETGHAAKINIQALYATSSGAVKNGNGNTIWEPQGAESLFLGGCVTVTDIEWDSGTGVLYVYTKY